MSLSEWTTDGMSLSEWMTDGMSDDNEEEEEEEKGEKEKGEEKVKVKVKSEDEGEEEQEQKEEEEVGTLIISSGFDPRPVLLLPLELGRGFSTGCRLLGPASRPGGGLLGTYSRFHFFCVPVPASWGGVYIRRGHPKRLTTRKKKTKRNERKRERQRKRTPRPLYAVRKTGHYRRRHSSWEAPAGVTR